MFVNVIDAYQNVIKYQKLPRDSTSAKYCIVMERLDMDLFDLVTKKPLRCLNEEEARCTVFYIPI